MSAMIQTDTEDVTEPMMVQTKFEWPNGHETSKVIDWNNRRAVSHFARASRRALSEGAKITTQRVQILPYAESSDDELPVIQEPQFLRHHSEGE